MHSPIQESTAAKITVPPDARGRAIAQAIVQQIAPATGIIPFPSLLPQLEASLAGDSISQLGNSPFPHCGH